MQLKIENISALVRWLIIFTISVLLINSGYNFFIKDMVNFGTDPVTLNQLWHNEKADRSILVLFMLPSLLIVLAFGYWLQKLLSLFQRGEFFSDLNMRCFLWLVWLNFVAGIDGIFSPAILGAYGNTIDPNIQPKFIFEIMSILTMLLLVVIVHLLKSARQLEIENKEFV